MREELKNEYRRWMLKNRWSGSTIRHAMTFLDYLERKGLDWENLTYDKAQDFLLEQLDRGVKEETINGWIKQINRWFAFKGIKPSLKYYPKEDISRRVYIPDEKVKQILSVRWKNYVIDIRNRAILHVLFSTGIRVSELVSLDISDLHLEEGYLVVRKGKGGKRRDIPLPSTTVEILREYLNVRLDTDPHALFTTRWGRIWDASIRRIMKEAGKKAGISWIHPHAARHWRAKNLLREGVLLNTVAEILGHSDLKTTLVYLRPTDVEITEDIRKKDVFFEKEVKV